MNKRKGKDLLQKVTPHYQEHKRVLHRSGPHNWRHARLSTYTRQSYVVCFIFIHEKVDFSTDSEYDNEIFLFVRILFPHLQILLLNKFWSFQARLCEKTYFLWNFLTCLLGTNVLNLNSHKSWKITKHNILIQKMILLSSVTKKRFCFCICVTIKLFRVWEFLRI